jgi:hypothetical protein
VSREGRPGLHGRCEPERPARSHARAISGSVVHMNLHKTFTTPHGGGGPGRGAGRVHAHLAPHMPAPAVVQTPARGALTGSGRSHRQAAVVLGQLRCTSGPTYIRTMGPDGLRAISENAILNANYIRARLLPHYDCPTRAPRCTRSSSPPGASCARRFRDRHAAARSRLLCPVDLLPADRRRGAHDRADRDGVEGTLDASVTR